MNKIFYIILFCLLVTGFLPQIAIGKEIQGPNISVIYSIENIAQQLPALSDKQRLKIKEPIPEAAKIPFQRLFSLNKTIALEAGRLPAFQNEIKEKDLLALTRLTELIENAQPEQMANLESLLNVGIKESRRYSSPLEALLWILGKDDYMQHKDILKISLENLLDKAWDFSDKTRWQDYETVTDRLNAPELVNYYQRIRLIYISDAKSKLNPFYGDARNLFEKNSGNCYDHSAFASYCLGKAGYKTSVVGVHPSKPEFHVVCKYEIDGKSYYLDNGRPDKFLRRGIIPKEEYEMYRERENVKKGEIAKDPVYLLQDNHGFVLVYLMDQKEKLTNVTIICKQLGLGGFEEKVKSEYLPELVNNGFITKPVYKSFMSDDFEYKINEALCQKFKAERYNRHKNSSARW